ncbi:MAG: 4Fe-4S ferredoxin [Chloroflexi bacterium]|nr:4Fe-4S ferredoxin [Chloroflexota bacterium]
MKIPFIKESTQEFIKEARKLPNYTLLDFLHGYIYGRWIYHYIDIGTGNHPAVKKYLALKKKLGNEPENKPATPSKGMSESYHGKAIPLETAKQMVQINEELNVPDLEQVIPYKRARSIVMKNPEHIVALDCPCRSAKENPCMPMDVCLVVGDPFASFIRDHHPDRSREITRDEAVEILKAEDERGHVHHAFFKDAMLERFYAICNCCECCCGAMNAHNHGTPMLASSGFVAQVDEDMCISCDNCVEYCQFGALEMDDFVMNVSYEKCMGCGVCVDICEQDSITLVADAEKGIPLEICALMAQVA